MKYLLVSIFLVCSSGFVRTEDGKAGSNANPSPQQSYTEDDSDMYMEPMDHQPQETNIAIQKEPQQNENSFYPSYSQPLGHSRPFFEEFQEFQEGAYSQRAQPPFQQVFDAPARFPGFKDNYRQSASNAAPAPETHSLLGSGNFGVIKGGTFYNENDGVEQGEQTSYSDFNDYFHNGHGRPSFYGGGRPNPKPYKHEQFANFKDFADINTPTDRQYSQYVVVYVNKNGTEQPAPILKPIHKPKNIIESLALLDLEAATTTEPVPEKKMSKSKRKLAQLPPQKKYKVQLLKKESLAKDLNEPLLALS